MAHPTHSQQKKKFISVLEQLGGKCGNTQLRNKLKWSDTEYWRIHGQLIDADQIVSGRGKGGSVILQKTRKAARNPRKKEKEDKYYVAVRETLESEFMKEQGYEQSVVQLTARLGRRETGGRWTRPDLVAFGIKKFKYIPEKTVELISFEVKTRQGVEVTSFYEALAHSNRANRSYLLFCGCNRKQFEKESEAERIADECEKHGIGLICIEKADDFSTWDIMLIARKNRDYSEDVEQAIEDLLDDDAKQEIRDLAKLKVRIE